MSAIFGSLLGATDGSFFKPPKWVDTKKRPGHTSQDAAYAKPDWFVPYLTTASFFLSPNLLWFAVAASIYVVFPYNYEAAKVFEIGWMIQRALINLSVTFFYFGFWHATLYVYGWGSRKFKPESGGPSKARFFHNCWYTALGALQGTGFEILFVHCYATGKIGYVSDEDVMSSHTEMAKLFAWILFVPIWRDFHFYIAHRFTHIRVLYKYVHSLHHRNTDIEPFSGLCMHPIEHLYYFSCVGPSLYIHASPFIMTWNIVHLLISPAASHSGWEDNMQSDQFHYLHHSKFECNYGTSGMPFDKWFGTYRDRMGPKSDSYKGQYDNSYEDKVVDAKKKTKYLEGNLDIHGILPDNLGQGLYNSFNIVQLLVLIEAIKQGGSALNLNVNQVGLLIAVGPLVFGCLLLLILGDKKSPVWPFHKDSAPNLGFHVIVGALCTILPVYHMVISVLGEKGEAPYHNIFGQ